VEIEVRVELIGLVVKVRHWPGASRSEDYVSSCNVMPVEHSDHWTDTGVVNSFGQRLAQRNGRAKGRVLYLKQLRLGRGHVLTGGLSYHVDPPRGGLLQVTRVAVIDTMPELDVVPAISKLLLCAQRIALVAPLNHGRLQWICTSRDEESAAERFYDFRRVARLDHGRSLMERPPVVI
jgi:hypothetical protein